MRNVVILAGIFLLICFVGACNIGDNEENSLTSPQGESRIIAGDIHTEFLQKLMPRVKKVSAESGESIDVCLTIANEMADKYGIKRFTREEVQAAVQLGRKLASTKTEFTMEEVLSGKELEWWDRFSNEATPLTARAVYEKYCSLYGTPTPGSTLETVMSIAISSSEFWPEYHAMNSPGLTSAGFWKRLLRFTVDVGVDITAGAMAGGGVGGGIVGGLASYGADQLLFGRDSSSSLTTGR